MQLLVCREESRAQPWGEPGEPVLMDREVQTCFPSFTCRFLSDRMRWDTTRHSKDFMTTEVTGDDGGSLEACWHMADLQCGVKDVGKHRRQLISTMPHDGGGDKVWAGCFSGVL